MFNTTVAAQKRRKNLTYGKSRQTPGNSFSHDLDAYYDEKRTQNGGRVTKANQASRPARRHDGASDAQTSDEESGHSSDYIRLTLAASEHPPKILVKPSQLSSPHTSKLATRQKETSVKRKRQNVNTSETLVKSGETDTDFDVPVSPTASSARATSSSVSGPSPSKSESVTPKFSKVRKKLPADRKRANEVERQRKPATPPPPARSSQASSSSTSPESNSIQTPSTPQTQVRIAASPGRQASIFSTPRQKRLWQDLIASDTDEGGMVSDKYASESSQRALPSVNLMNQIGPPKRKLIDRLAASSRSESEFENDESVVEDEEASPTENEPSRTGEKEMEIDAPFDNIQSSQDHSSALNKSSQGRSNVKFTYAGTRSYLQDSVDDMDAWLHQPLEMDDSIMQLPTRSSILNPAADSRLQKEEARFGEEDDGDAQAVRNVHELRAAGDAHRFAEEMEITITELASCTSNLKSKASLSPRRNVWLELAEKLVDKQLQDRMLQHGYDHRIFTIHTATEHDPVVMFLMASAVVLVLGNDSTTTETAEHLRSIGIGSLLIRLLDYDREMSLMVKDRAMNMSKVAQTSVMEFGKTIASLAMWSEMPLRSLSPSLMALKAFDSLIRRCSSSADVLDGSLLDKLIGLMEHGVSHAAYLVISILESFTTSPTCCSNGTLWSEPRMKKLVSCLESLLSIKEPGYLLQNLISRLCLNLANSNSKNSKRFASRSFIEQILGSVCRGFEQVESEKEVDESEDIAYFEALILSLGASINLAECSDVAREVIAETASPFELLLRVFVKSRERAGEADSLAKSRANIPFGYLAIFLGQMCQNQSARLKIQQQLPDKQLTLLVSAVDEFIAFNKAADRNAVDNDSFVAFTERLQRVADVLKGS